MSKTRNLSSGCPVVAAIAVLAFSSLSTPAIAQSPFPQPAPARPAGAPKAPPAVAKPQPNPAPVSQAAVAPAAPAQQPAANRGEIVARVGAIELREADIRSVVLSLGAREQAALQQDPALLSQVVRTILANQLVLQEALSKQWERQPAIAVQIQRVRDNAIAETYLQSVAAVSASFPNEADIQALYDANQTAFVVPRQFQVAQIYVALANDADKVAQDKARAKLDAITRRLKQPNSDFAAVAKTESDAKETAERGGEIGWVAEPQLRPEIKATVLGLGKGAVSEPLKLDDGWHIVRLIDTKPASTRPLSEVRDQLAQRLREERAAANRRAYLAELLRQNPPAINELALSKVLGERNQAAR